MGGGIAWLAALAVAAAGASGQELVLANEQVARTLAFDGSVWRTVRFARRDGSAALAVRSDEFHALGLTNACYTLDDFVVDGEPLRAGRDGEQTVTIRYRPRAGAKREPDAPLAVTITYRLGRDSYLRKAVEVTMPAGQAIDRLEVERFSVAAPARRGGRGEPVLIDDAWWFGVEYPAFYSRHTDGNTPKWQEGPYDRMPSYPSVIWLDGRDVEPAARPGLVRLMHFPGSARKLDGDRWGIVSKTAVCGPRTPGLTLELSFLDYLATIRRPVRSFIHYNNWYDPEGKRLSVDNFVRRTFVPMRDGLAPYGVKIHAMVPDDGWQDRRSIYQPTKGHFPGGWADVQALGQALEREGTRLGIWFALNGYGGDMAWAQASGYREAARNPNFSRWGRYYALAEPKYNAAVRESLRKLIVDCRLNYFKHDFNDMCDLRPSGQPQTDRHGHEAEVDATLDLLATERELDPAVYQNMTNWIWFSPWWLQVCDTIWMLAGDDGLHQGLPELSTLAMASLYRDVHLHRAWGLGADRPLVPLSHLMTHGIIYTSSLYGRGPDTVRDFADNVMAYYARGLKLKEWYLTPSLMRADHWRALGTLTRWAEEQQGTLVNATMVGGSPARGEPFGYVSWNGDHGILAVRNTLPGEAETTVPFDQSVFYRGAPGQPFAAQVVYPYHAPWPAAFRSGEPLKLRLPGYTMLVLHLTPGLPAAQQPSAPPPLAVTGARAAPVGRWEGSLTVPDEALGRCDLLLIIRSGEPSLEVDGARQTPSRTSRGAGWRMAAFDLLPQRGKTVRLALAAVGAGEDPFPAGVAQVEAWLLADRAVADPPADNDPRLPWAIAQGTRRQTQQLFAGSLRGRPAVGRSVTADDLRTARAAKLRIETFGLQTAAGGWCRLALNGETVAEAPSTQGNDTWETRVLDIPADKLRVLATSNTVVLTRERDGDKFKFRGLMLAVQLADGTWVASAGQEQSQCSHADWAFHEGQTFPQPGVTAAPVVLRWP